MRNLDGWADYKPPGDDDNLLTIRPGRQIRVGVSIERRRRPSGCGGERSTPPNPATGPTKADTVTFGCVDAKGDAGRAEMPAPAHRVGYGDTGTARFYRLFDNVAWPAWRREADTDAVPLHGTDFGTRVADELDRTAESASGHVYGDIDGKVAFRRQDWMVWPGTDPPDARSATSAAGDVCPSGWEIRFGRDDITTVAIVGRDGETPLVMDEPRGRRRLRHRNL